MAETKTPRTDRILTLSDELAHCKDVTPFAVQALCRELETELAAAQAEIAALKKERDKPIWLFADLP